MSILDGVLGGLVGAGVTSAISHVIEQQGGVQGLVEKFQQNGLGGIVQSWVGTGANQAVSTDQISQVLGSDMVKNLAAKFGIPADQIASVIAQHLPAAVDQITPNGTIPAAA